MDGLGPCLKQRVGHVLKEWRVAVEIGTRYRFQFQALPREIRVQEVNNFPICSSRRDVVEIRKYLLGAFTSWLTAEINRNLYPVCNQGGLLCRQTFWNPGIR